MNHTLNAQLLKLPACPECDAEPEKPCVAFHGGTVPREPHRVRQRIASGELVAIPVLDAKNAKKLRALRELVAVIQNRSNR